MAELSDTQIRANLRATFAESGIDPNQTSFICARGIVRVLGELASAHKDAQLQPAQVDALADSIKRTRGVARVHFHLKDWKRLPTGDWVRVESGECGAGSEADDELT